MLDYYSNFEGPNRNEAIEIINTIINQNNKPQWLKKYVSIYVDKEINNMEDYVLNQAG